MDRRPPTTDWSGKLELLVLQPSPFCNLDCSYCYLPARNDRRRMTHDTLRAIARSVFDARLPDRELAIVWHAGEPLAVPPAWYREAFALLDALRPRDVHLTHHFQTNAVLIDDEWCEFLATPGVHVGVSLDGPAWLHDRHRRKRNGHGTHATVMRGIQRLRDAGIPFHAICVLTRDALLHAEELLDFFGALGSSCLCFNVEEQEASNVRSSLSAARPGDGAEIDRLYRAFMRLVVDRVRSGRVPRVREVDAVLAALRHPEFGRLTGNSQNEAGRILSVSWDGRYATFSPELLGVVDPALGRFTVGHVATDRIPPSSSREYESQRAEIAAGVARCRAECRYFDFCLGGAPANKLGEHGRLDATETTFCRLTQQITVDVVLEALDADLGTRTRRGDGEWLRPLGVGRRRPGDPGASTGAGGTALA